MNQTIDTARGDLAFLKALADDEYPLPGEFGAQLLAPGAIFGVTLLLMGAVRDQRVNWPASWFDWLWIPATALYALALLAIRLMRKGRPNWGPNKRAFAAAWAGFGAMNVGAAIILVLARAPLGIPLLIPLVLPTIGFILFGGTWAIIAQLGRNRWAALTATGCFATAAVAAVVTGTPYYWTVTGAGVLLWAALPGLLILIAARRGTRR
jgi:hypothetical protein